MGLREFLTQILAIVPDRLLVNPTPLNCVELRVNKRRPKTLLLHGYTPARAA
jgi:hypothetical protein